MVWKSKHLAISGIFAACEKRGAQSFLWRATEPQHLPEGIIGYALISLKACRLASGGKQKNQGGKCMSERMKKSVSFAITMLTVMAMIALPVGDFTQFNVRGDFHWINNWYTHTLWTALDGKKSGLASCSYVYSGSIYAGPAVTCNA